MRPRAGAFMRLSESTKKVPEITIRSPGMSPFVTSTSSPMRDPVSTSRGSKYPLPRSTNTVLRSPESTIASAGTTSVGGRSTGNSTSTNMPGLSARCGFAASSRTFSVSVSSSKIGSDGLTVADSARLCFRRGDPRGGAAADERQLVAVHVGQNPHAVQIRDPVELEPAIEPEAGRDAALQHDAVHRRLHADVMHELAALAHLPELRVGYAHVPQRVGDPVDRLGARRESCDCDCGCALAMR